MAKAKRDGYISFEIKIGGSKIKFADSLASINTFNEVFRIPTATLTFVDGSPSDQKFELSSDVNLAPGKEVTISIGYNGTNEEVFSGIIIKHSLKIRSTSSILLIECKNKAAKMTVGRKNALYEEKDDKKIITSLFSNSGLSSAVSCEGSFVSHDSLVQYESTDWDFMVTRAEVNDKLVAFDGKKFQVKDVKLSGSAAKKYEYGKDIFEFESTVNAESQLKAVESYSWDMEKQEQVKSAAAASGFKQLENKDVKISDLESVTSPAKFEMYHGGSIPKAELDSWGKSKLSKASLGKIRGRLKVFGDNSINPGDVVELIGLGDKFSGDILVTAVKQEYTEAGWYTHIQFGLSEKWFTERFKINTPPASALLSAVNGLQVGKVVKIDGDANHRIQVSLPVSGETIKIWARMTSFYAGNNYGVCFWPEKDDEVIIGFLNDDPRFPVVLGMVYSKKNVPTIKPDEKNEKKAIISKSDIRITFDDKDKVLELKTPGENTITLDDKAKSITLKDQHGNEFVMEKAGISIKSKGTLTLEGTKDVTLKSKTGDINIDGKNVNAKAKAKFSANGNAGVEVKTSAIAVLKGSMVKIN